MPFVESFEEFKQRHNCEVIQIKQGDFEDAWLFANGAACVLQKLGLNRSLETHEPPQEQFALLRAKRLFVAAKLGEESKAYQAALTDYQQQANLAAKYPHACPAVPKAAMASLRNGWDFIEKMRVDLEQLDQQLAQSPEAIQRVQRRQLAER